MDNGASSYRRFLDGDESAFDDIMNELFRGLVFFVNRYVCDPYAAEDIAIDVFSELIIHKNRYNFKTSLKTYLYMMGRSRALDYLKHEKKLTFTELGDSAALSCEQQLLEEAVLKDKRRKAVNDAVSALPEKMREAVFLVYFEDMTYDEAAKVLGKSKKQIDNLLYRAKKELRVILEEESELEL